MIAATESMGVHATRMFGLSYERRLEYIDVHYDQIVAVMQETRDFHRERAWKNVP